MNANFPSKFRRHLKWLLLVLLGVGMAGAVIAGMRYYKYRQSAQYAFVSLKEALSPADVGVLAKRVDFNAISRHLAEESIKSFPFFKQGPEQMHDLQTVFQVGLLRIFKTAPEEVPEEKDPKKKLLAPMFVLPADFLEQFSAGLTMHSAEKDAALLTTSVRHPLLEKNFPIILSMARTSRGWVVRDLLNARELVKGFHDAMIQRLHARRGMLTSQKESTVRRMDEILPIQSCSASAGLISDRRTLLLAVRVIARNRSNVTVQNMNVQASITDRKGRELLRRFLNAVQPTAPGEDFDWNWNIELDGHGELGRQVLAAGPLSCNVEWKTLTLGSSHVLHAQEVIDELAPCTEAGHDHPQGICRSAIFQESAGMSQDGKGAK